MTDTSIDTPTARQRIRAPRGAILTCKGWRQEAALRIFMNSLDPDVTDCAAGSSYESIVTALRNLENDHTLLLQSGKPPEDVATKLQAPRVLAIGNGRASTWMNVWMDLGIQGSVSRSFEIFAAAARKCFGGSLGGKLVVSGGMGRSGGACALAVTLNGGAFLGIDVDPERIKRRVKGGYCDVMVNDLDEALRILKNAVRKREPASVGVVGNCADLIPELAERGIVPDLLTDQTSAPNPPNDYVPHGLDLSAAAKLRARDPDEYRRRALDSIVVQLRAMLELQTLGAVTFDSGNNIREIAFEHGVKNAFDIRETSEDYLWPLLSAGRVPLEWVALSGEPSDIDRIDRLIVEMFSESGSENENLTKWIRLAQRRLRLQGLPSRAGWFNVGERGRFGVAVNELVARGELKAPIVIILDGTISKAATRVGGDGADPKLFLDAASDSCWIAIQNDGEASAGNHASQGLVADGAPETAAGIERNLSNYSTPDP